MERLILLLLLCSCSLPNRMPDDMTIHNGDTIYFSDSKDTIKINQTWMLYDTTQHH